jgi:hypothetical protein
MTMTRTRRSEHELVREYRATDQLLHELRAHRAHLRLLLDELEDEHGRDRAGMLDDASRRKSRHPVSIGRPRSR